jgi:hypothetical protein
MSPATQPAAEATSRRPVPSTRALAWSLWALCAAICAAGLALVVLDWNLHVGGASWGFRGFDGVLAFPIATVGVVLALRRPRHPIGWLFLVCGVESAVQFAGIEYAAAAILGHRALPGVGVAVWLETWGWLPTVAPLTIYMPLLYPTGRLLSRRWAWVAWAAGLTLLLGCFGLGFAPGAVKLMAFASNPLGTQAGWVMPVLLLGLMGCVASMALAAISLVLRVRRGSATERQQVKWLAYAVFIVAIAIPPGAMTFLPQQIQKAAQVVVILGFLAVPVAVMIAILKYRLYDIDRLISRTLSYAIVTGLLVAVYVGLVTLATRFLPFSSPLGVAASTLAAAALFNPLRRRVQRLVDSRFNRARYDAEATVAAFARRVRDDVDLEVVSSEFVRAVQTSVEPAHVSLWLRPTGSRS